MAVLEFKTQSRRAMVKLNRLCALMANHIRLSIMVELSDRPLNVSTLTKRIGVSMPEISHGLKDLRKHDLVRMDKLSRERIYRLGNVRAIREGAKTVLQIRAAGGSLIIALP